MVSRGLGWEVVRLLSWEEQTGSRVRPKPVPSTPLRSRDQLGETLGQRLHTHTTHDTQVLFDEDATIHTYSTLDKAKHLRTLVTRGGMLADEMVCAPPFVASLSKSSLLTHRVLPWRYLCLITQGLGKTLVVLSLIAMQKANVDKIIARDDELRPLDEVSAPSPSLI
jgi:hypothetical protein